MRRKDGSLIRITEKNFLKKKENGERNLKIKIELDDPTKPKNKIQKTFTFNRFSAKEFCRKLLRMTNESMVIIPIQVTFQLDGQEYTKAAIISIPNVTSGFSGRINQRPKQKVPLISLEIKTPPKKRFSIFSLFRTHKNEY